MIYEMKEVSIIFKDLVKCLVPTVRMSGKPAGCGT